jgi:general secretion pathway protein N
VLYPAADAVLRMSFDGRALHVQSGEARVPAAVLAALGAPFNTIRPGGTLRARWELLRFERDAFDGDVQIDWEDAQSALSPVAPLGRFRVTALGHGMRGEAKLTTLEGPLLLEGDATLENGGIHFTASASAQPDMRANLEGLIALLGRRVGDRVLIKGGLHK